MPDVSDGTDVLGHGVLGNRETGLEGGLLTGAAHLGMRCQRSGGSGGRGLDDLAARVDSDPDGHGARPLAVGHGLGPVLKGVAHESADAGLAGEHALAGVAVGRALLATSLAVALAEGVFHLAVGGIVGGGLLLGGLLFSGG